MDLKQTAGLLGWPRERTRLAIEDGVDILPGHRVQLGAERCGNDYDVSDSELASFMNACEALEPGRHPPIGIRRQLLIEARFKCAICISDAPLQYHHIVEWADLRHHDPRHMLAVCGVCHDKITRIGQIDIVAQRMIKERLQLGVFPRPPIQGAQIPEEIQQPRERPITIIDQSNEERLVWLLPRGLILLDDVRYQAYSSWSVVANYFDFAQGWLQGTHYHKNYADHWREPRDRQIQFRKMWIPIGDWFYVEGALDLIRQIAEVDNSQEFDDVIQRRQRRGDPLLYFPPGARIILEELPKDKYARMPAPEFRDVMAEIREAMDAPADSLFDLHRNAQSLRHRGTRVAWQMLPAGHPSLRFIQEVVDRYELEMDSRTLLHWLAELSVVLQEAAA